MNEDIKNYILAHPEASLEDILALFPDFDVTDTFNLILALNLKNTSPKDNTSWATTLNKVKDLVATGKFSKAWNNAMPFAQVAITGAGVSWDLMNDIWGGNQNPTLSLNTIDQSVLGGYTGTAGEVKTSTAEAEKANVLKNLFNINDKLIASNNAKIKQMGTVSDHATDWQNASTGMTASFNGLRREHSMMGGYDLRTAILSKEGGKLEAEWKPIISLLVETFKTGGTIVNEWTPKIDINEFKTGGEIKTLTDQLNIIPEGALHKEKHHLKDVGFDTKNITKKGIPVIDNEGHQLAEIELNEIIFTLEVTKKLEEGYKKYYETDKLAEKDQLALDAGHLLWHEIMYHTDNRTGLIETCKEGGVLKAQEGTKTKPSYQEWVKDVNPEFNHPEMYDLEMAFENLPYERLQRWKKAVNSEDPNVYLAYQDPKTGEYVYHLPSIIPYRDNEYIFLKKGTEKTNPEVHYETDTYYSGENGLKETHDLIYDEKEGRYFYRKKKVK